MTCRCRSGERDPECDGPKLRAEIERLEKREVDAWTERDAYLEQNVKLKAEIERLRAAEDYDLRCKKSLRAEVRRLRTLLNASESLKSGYLDEIERLKLLVYSNLGDNHHNANDCPYCKAETARLRAALRQAADDLYHNGLPLEAEEVRRALKDPPP